MRAVAIFAFVAATSPDVFDYKDDFDRLQPIGEHTPINDDNDGLGIVKNHIGLENDAIAHSFQQLHQEEKESDNRMDDRMASMDAKMNPTRELFRHESSFLETTPQEDLADADKVQKEMTALEDKLKAQSAHEKAESEGSSFLETGEPTVQEKMAALIKTAAQQEATFAGTSFIQLMKLKHHDTMEEACETCVTSEACANSANCACHAGHCDDSTQEKEAFCWNIEAAAGLAPCPEKLSATADSFADLTSSKDLESANADLEKAVADMQAMAKRTREAIPHEDKVKSSFIQTSGGKTDIEARSSSAKDLAAQMEAKENAFMQKAMAMGLKIDLSHVKQVHQMRHFPASFLQTEPKKTDDDKIDFSEMDATLKKLDGVGTKMQTDTNKFETDIDSVAASSFIEVSPDADKIDFGDMDDILNKMSAAGTKMSTDTHTMEKDIDAAASSFMQVDSGSEDLMKQWQQSMLNDNQERDARRLNLSGDDGIFSDDTHLRTHVK